MLAKKDFLSWKYIFDSRSCNIHFVDSSLAVVRSAKKIKLVRHLRWSKSTFYEQFFIASYQSVFQEPRNTQKWIAVKKDPKNVGAAFRLPGDWSRDQWYQRRLPSSKVSVCPSNSHNTFQTSYSSLFALISKFFIIYSSWQNLPYSKTFIIIACSHAKKTLRKPKLRFFLV